MRRRQRARTTDNKVVAVLASSACDWLDGDLVVHADAGAVVLLVQVEVGVERLLDEVHPARELLLLLDHPALDLLELLGELLRNVGGDELPEPCVDAVDSTTLRDNVLDHFARLLDTRTCLTRENNLFPALGDVCNLLECELLTVELKHKT